MKYAIALFVALSLNAAANLMMKAGAGRLNGPKGLLDEGVVHAIRSHWILIVGLACFAANAFCYIYALRPDFMKISFAYPIMVGGGYLIIALVAWKFLGEHMSAIQWVGVAMILVGACLVATQMDTAAGS
jgi:multidrug transporter EmrE-like cation transporter